MRLWCFLQIQSCLWIEAQTTKECDEWHIGFWLSTSGPELELISWVDWLGASATFCIDDHHYKLVTDRNYTWWCVCVWERESMWSKRICKTAIHISSKRNNFLIEKTIGIWTVWSSWLIGCIKCMGRACDQNVALTEAIQTKVANNMSSSS